jgi:hypothetical protein
MERMLGSLRYVQYHTSKLFARRECWEAEAGRVLPHVAAATLMDYTYTSETTRAQVDTS